MFEKLNEYFDRDIYYGDNMAIYCENLIYM